MNVEDYLDEAHVLLKKMGSIAMAASKVTGNLEDKIRFKKLYNTYRELGSALRLTHYEYQDCIEAMDRACGVK